MNSALIEVNRQYTSQRCSQSRDPRPLGRGGCKLASDLSLIKQLDHSSFNTNDLILITDTI